MEYTINPFEKPVIKGSEKISGLLSPNAEGYLASGYVASGDIPFGAVCKEVANSNKAEVGVPALLSQVAGVAIYDQATASDRPQLANSYRDRMQCNILYKGFCWYYLKDATTVSKASKVFANTNTGAVGFGSTVPKDCTEIKWIKIAKVDESKKGVLVYVNIYCECGMGGGGDEPVVADWAYEGSTAKIPQSKLDGYTATKMSLGTDGTTQVIELLCNDAYIGDKTDSGDNIIVTRDYLDSYPTTNEMNTALAKKQPVGDYATTKQLEGYATEASVTALTTTVNGKATKATTLAGYGITDGATKASLASYATKESVDDLTTTVNGKATKATTLAGYGITDGATAKSVTDLTATVTALAERVTALETALESLTTTVNGKATKATTLAGYGITDGATKASVTALETTVNGKATKATTLAGYGITDAYTKTEADAQFQAKETTTP